MSKMHREEKITNRKMLLTFFQNIRFLACQGLPLRDSNHMEVQSNFDQLLLLRALDCPDILTWMNKKSNKYMSHDIQNECLRIMAHNIIREVGCNISKSGCFTIMADECTDVANKEQFTICIRWVGDDPQDHEDFIGMYQVDG